MTEGERRWRLVRGSVHPATGRGRLLRWLAAVAALAVCATAVWVVYGTSLFAVTQVRVTGTAVLSPAAVRDAAAVRTGTPLARLDTDAVAERVSRLAPVERVLVEREWPDTVAIRVTERTPVAAVPHRGRFLVIDGTGVVFDAAAKRPRHLPLVEVARPAPSDATTRDALRVLAALTPQLRAVLLKVKAASPTRITLYLTKGRSVVWGDAESSERKAQVATVLLKRPVRVIDVSAPDVVTTR